MGEIPAVTGSNAAVAELSEQAQCLIATLRHAVIGEQTVAAVVHGIEVRTLVHQIGDCPVAEGGYGIHIFADVFGQPDGFVAGVARKVALP